MSIREHIKYFNSDPCRTHTVYQCTYLLAQFRTFVRTALRTYVPVALILQLFSKGTIALLAHMFLFKV